MEPEDDRTAQAFSSIEDDISYLRRLIDNSNRIVAFTGAGISTESGIPDYRGASGLWTTNPDAERAATYANYMSSPDVRRAYWTKSFGSLKFDADPNEGHKALVKLYEKQKLRAVITQNVDGLHQAAGLPDVAVHELHGNARSASCVDCLKKYDTAEVIEECYGPNPSDATCGECGGVLRPDVVMFGETLNGAVWQKAEGAAMGCSLMLVLGSSLQVFPAAGLVGVAQQMGADTAIINRDPTDYDAMATLVIRRSIGATLAAALED